MISITRGRVEKLRSDENETKFYWFCHSFWLSQATLVTRRDEYSNNKTVVRDERHAQQRQKKLSGCHWLEFVHVRTDFARAYLKKMEHTCIIRVSCCWKVRKSPKSVPALNNFVFLSFIAPAQLSAFWRYELNSALNVWIQRQSALRHKFSAGLTLRW